MGYLAAPRISNLQPHATVSKFQKQEYMVFRGQGEDSPGREWGKLLRAGNILYLDLDAVYRSSFILPPFISCSRMIYTCFYVSSIKS